MVRRAGIFVRADSAQAEKTSAFGHVALKKFDDTDQLNLLGRGAKTVAAGVPAYCFDDSCVAEHQEDLGEVVLRYSSLSGQLLSAHRRIWGLGRQVC